MESSYTPEVAADTPLPDPKICRTQPIGRLKSFAACLVTGRISCPYSIGFDGGRFCTSPHRNRFSSTLKEPHAQP